MASNAAPTYNRRPAQRKALAKLGITTEKRPTAGNNVSHAMNKTKRVFKPNLQKATVVVDGKKVTVRVDTRALRTLTKPAKERTPRPPQVTKKAPRVSGRAAAAKKTS